MRKGLMAVASGLVMILGGRAGAQGVMFPPPALFAPKADAPQPYVVDWSVQAPAAAPAPPAPTVVCGMTVVRADPKADPKMRVAPKNDGVKYAMRTVPPSICTTPPR